MEEKDEIVCICSIENTGHTIGVRIPCRGQDCKETVWLSDTTIKNIKESNPGIDLDETPPTPLCINCGIKVMQKSKDFKIVPPSKDQMIELKNAISEIRAKQG